MTFWLGARKFLRLRLSDRQGRRRQLRNRRARRSARRSSIFLRTFFLSGRSSLTLRLFLLVHDHGIALELGPVIDSQRGLGRLMSRFYQESIPIPSNGKWARWS